MKTVAVLKTGSIDVHTRALLDFLSTLEGIRLILLNPLTLSVTRSVEHQQIRDAVSKKIETVSVEASLITNLLLGLALRTEALSWLSVLLGRLAVWYIGRKLSAILQDKNVEISDIICVAELNFYLATRVRLRHNFNILYYSLEIWDRGNFNGFREWLIGYEMRNTDQMYRVIIQDDDRYEYFGKTRTSQPKPILLPLGLTQQKIAARSTYLQEQLRIEPHKQSVLYWGQYVHGRFLDELMSVFNEAKADFVVIFQGGREFASIEQTPWVAGTGMLVEYENISPRIIASCDVGIALYGQHDANNRLTARSSEKIARYCQCGKPFIAIRNDNYENFQNSYRCCELIDDITQTPAAIRAILDDYDLYRREAFRAFDEIFDYQQAGRNLKAYLQST